MILENLRAKVLEIANQMLMDGVVHGSQGNVSARDPETGFIAITPSAIPYGQLQAHEICIIRNSGEIVDAVWTPTSERLLHLAIYARRGDVNAVVHSHALYSSVFGVVHLPLNPILTEAAMCVGDDVPVAEYRRPGTQDLADITANTLGSGSCVIMAHHGLVTVGRSLDEAYDSTLAVETSARVMIMAQSMGEHPSALPAEEAAAMRELYLSKYHPTKMK